jgi:VWFA-related protein
MQTASWSRQGSVAVLCVLFTAGVSGVQQQPAPAVERSPGLMVDFGAVSADGTPVADLTAAEVELKIDGRTRAIQSLRLVRAADAASSAAPPTPALPAPYSTNGQDVTRAGRNIVIALDDDSFRPGSEVPVREAVNGLLSELTPRDRVMFVTMPYGGVKEPFTTDHARIRVALAGTAGQRGQSETGSEMACRTRRLLQSLAGFLETLSTGEGPSTVLFFTAGLAGPRRDAPTALAPGMCELTVDAFRRVAEVAGAARAFFYIVQPDDVSMHGNRGGTLGGATALGSDNPLEGIENLAGVTGGQRVPLQAVGRGALSRVARETSAYYVAEIAPQRSDLNNRSHRMSVKVRRPGVVVRTRPDVTFVAAPAVPPRRTAANAYQMLLVSDVFSELPLRGAGFVAGDAGGKVRVVAVAESPDPSVILSTAAAALVDPSGRVVAQWTAPDAAEIPLAGAMLVAPGTYRLRIAATDTNGRGGTVDAEMAAVLTPAGPLTISSLLLGLSRDGALIPKLEFGSEPVALSSFEIYGEAKSKVSAGLDVARSLDGPAILSIPLAIERSGDNRFVATGAVPIGALPAGDYIVRGRLEVDGSEGGRVFRTLRKVSR